MQEAASVSFWSRATVDELAAEQGIATPQHFGEMIGSAAELWNDEDDFRAFVDGIYQRRTAGRDDRKVGG